ncbi:MAG TPA: ABC transporter permease [Kofleriaceae bacterium]|nr:ABC transporter permease [Kofleriaceae bacterium]
MNLATYARRNLFRRRGRTILTMCAVALAVLIFCIIRTVIVEWNAGADAAAQDRLAIRHKVSITMQLPRHYVDDVRAMQGSGVKAVTWANWFGAKDPKERVPFFAGFAVDQNTWFDVMDEMQVDPAALAEWKKPENKNGAIIGDQLAKAFGVKVGDRMVVNSDIYPGDWDFKVIAIYQPLRRTADRNTLVFRWDYLTDDPRATFSKDQVGWMAARIDDPGRGPEISKAIDAKFSEKDDQTLTMSERAFQLGFLGGFSAVLKAFDLVSLGILLVMVLILANTIAMSARERTHEYGVLRAIGFPPGHILGFILGESVLVALVGGAIGMLVTIGLINGMVGPFIEENMSSMFPYFAVPMRVVVTAFVSAVIVGIVAGIVPAILASRLKVTDALRRLD